MTGANIEAARAGHEHAVAECLECSFTAVHQAPPKMLIAGNDAIGFGAVASGCKFYAGFPMTPTTGILTYVAGKTRAPDRRRTGRGRGRGDQHGARRILRGSAVDDLHLGRRLRPDGGGSVPRGDDRDPRCRCIGPAARSGDGPADQDRAGRPLLALFAGHGEFPRSSCPGSPEQAFFLTNKAFDLAEKYQVPAFVLTDQYLADTEWTCDGFDLSRLRYTDYRLRGDAVADPERYRRYAYSKKASLHGRAGLGRYLVVADSDEHDEEGHLIEDAETRVRMIEKRLFEKLPLIQAEMEPPILRGRRTRRSWSGMGLHLRADTRGGRRAGEDQEYRHAPFQRGVPAAADGR